MHSISVILHGLLRLDDIFEHSFNLIDSIMAAFDLKFLDHELFSFVGDTCLVQESLCKQVGEACDEDISTVEAAKQSDNGIKSFLDFVITKRFQAFLKFVVGVECDEMRCLIALVHEVLKSHVSCLLELHIILKCAFNDLVDLSFEGQ